MRLEGRKRDGEHEKRLHQAPGQTYPKKDRDLFFFPPQDAKTPEHQTRAQDRQVLPEMSRHLVRDGKNRGRRYRPDVFRELQREQMMEERPEAGQVPEGDLGMERGTKGQIESRTTAKN